MIIDTINIGVTTKCNAKCFSCDRNIFSNYIQNEDMEINIIKKLIPYCNRFVFIGSFGDFICHSKSLEIIELVQDKGIFFDTNAALHGHKYWTKLGSLMNQPGKLIRFNIESLDEIDHHRKVKTSKIIQNLSSYLEAGGNASVKIIKFKYNENQIDNMIKLFQSMGIKSIQLQKSRLYEKGGPLSAPSGVTVGTLQQLYEISNKINSLPKICPWKEKNTVYINENGELHPCCHLDGELLRLEVKNHNIFNPDTLKKYIGIDDFGNELYNLYNKCKNIINLNTSTFEDAYYSEYIQYAYTNFKNINKCKLYCNLPQKINDIILKPTDV